MLPMFQPDFSYQRNLRSLICVNQLLLKILSRVLPKVTKPLEISSRVLPKVTLICVNLHTKLPQKPTT